MTRPASARPARDRTERVASVDAAGRVSAALTPGASGPHLRWGLRDVARGDLPSLFVEAARRGVERAKYEPSARLATRKSRRRPDPPPNPRPGATACLTPADPAQPHASPPPTRRNRMPPPGAGQEGSTAAFLPRPSP